MRFWVGRWRVGHVSDNDVDPARACQRRERGADLPGQFGSRDAPPAGDGDHDMVAGHPYSGHLTAGQVGDHSPQGPEHSRLTAGQVRAASATASTSTPSATAGAGAAPVEAVPVMTPATSLAADRLRRAGRGHRR